MGYISDLTIERVKNAVDIVDLVGSYVELKRSGKNHKGLCPFHSEKTPSFIVTQERGTFNCFGCHEHGDGIGFVMKMEHLEFADAIRYLANKYGIPVEEDQGQSLDQRRYQRLYEINREAMLFYYRNLLTNKEPQRYLQRRKFKSSIINDFLLGYADNKGASLYQHLHEKGYEDADLLHLGLVSKSNRGTGYYDRFRNRLMFPIISKNNKIIGFGGRILGDGQPKYLNSPESDVFHKGDNLYGIHIVKKRKDLDKIILVEGYMDVIALFYHGIDYAVASLGTALTENQGKLAHRYGKKVYLCYDGDSAGIKASRRAVEVLENIDVIPKMILLPDGQDPDDYCQKEGVDAFHQQVDDAIDPIDFELRLMSAGYNLDDEKERLDFILEATDYLASIEQEAIRDVYIQKVAKQVDVDVDSLKTDIRNKEAKIRADKQKKQEEREAMEAYRNTREEETFVPYDDYMPDYYGEEDTYVDPYEHEDPGYFPPSDEGVDNPGKLGNREDRRLAKERDSLEYEVIRLSQRSGDCRDILLDEAEDFIQGETRIKFIRTIKNLCASKIPPEIGNLREALKDDESVRLLNRLENDGMTTANHDKPTWVNYAEELRYRIRHFSLRERKRAIFKALQGLRSDGEDTQTKSALLGELMTIEMQLKGEEPYDGTR